MSFKEQQFNFHISTAAIRKKILNLESYRKKIFFRDTKSKRKFEMEIYCSPKLNYTTPSSRLPQGD